MTTAIQPASETQEAKKQRVKRIIRILERTYPDTRLALNFSTPLELLIALILAAQCTDERVNRVTATLFKKYRTAQDWANADQRTLEEEIRSTGFYRNKAKAIRECCQALVTRYHGEVPTTLDELLTLPGVGRKTANILRGNVFGQPAIGVDTHVARLAQRLGLTTHTDPDKIEHDLDPLVPDKDKVRFCHLLQAHGRTVCLARKPKCSECVIAELCPYPTNTPSSVPSRRARRSNRRS
ncbi:MAG: endonuclease III [Nitrospirae bacterium]|nr:MAG: endonuclease III [Nitrospirota bacterium]